MTILKYLALLLVVLTDVTICFANEEHKILKRQVLSDCEAAKKSFETLDPSSQAMLVPYLARVLELEIHTIRSLRSPFTDPVQGLALSINEPKGLDASLPVDPNDELNAKRCSLELLGRVGKAAFPALPNILDLSQRPATPTQLRRLAAFQARDIALLFASNLPALTVEDEKTTADLGKFLDGQSTFITQAVYLELGQLSLPTIVARIPNATPSEAAHISLLLRDLQSNGVAVAPHLYPLLSSGEEALQVRIINLLAGLYPPLHEVLPPLIRLLDDISSQVREATRAALKRLVAKDDLTPFSLESTVQDSLITTFRISPPNERRQMLEWLPSLVGAVTGLEDRLITLYQGAPFELKRDILSCIAAMKNPSEKAFTLTKVALDEKDFLIRAHAVRTLGRFPSFEKETIKLLTKVFQTLPPVKDSTERELLQTAAADALVTLHPKALPDVLIIPLIQMLEVRSIDEKENDFYPFPKDSSPNVIRSRHRDHPAVKALIELGEPVRKLVEKTARTGDSDKARRAIAVLGQLPIQPSSVAILTALLSSTHQGTRAEAARALLNLGPQIVPLLRKQSEKLSGESAVTVSEVMILLGEKTLADSKKIYKSLDKADCSNRAQRIVLIGDFSPNEKGSLAQSLLTCLGQNHTLDHETIAALVHLAPLSPQQVGQVIDILKQPGTSPQLRFALLDHAKDLAIPGDSLFPVFTQLINEAPDSGKVRLIRSVGRYGSVNDELRIQLIRFIVNEERYHSRNLAIVAALAKTAPSFYNFTEWLKNELENSSLDPLRKTLRGFPDDFAESLLLQILPDLDDKKKESVLLLLSSSIKKHDQAPSAIIDLLRSHDTTIKFEAFRVFTACCSASAMSEEVLHELLYSAASYRLAEAPLTPDILAILEKIAAETKYRSEKAVAQRIVHSTHP